MKYINQRQSPRIDIRLQCQVSCPGLCPRTSMVTENISRNGLLVVWKSQSPGAGLPQPGQLVTVDIELPANHGFGRKCIHCQGVVVRVTVPQDGVPRVALNVNYMKFRAFREKIPALERLEPAGAATWLS